MFCKKNKKNIFIKPALPIILFHNSSSRNYVLTMLVIDVSSHLLILGILAKEEQNECISETDESLGLQSSMHFSARKLC